MDFSLNEEQKQIKSLIRDFAKREVDQARMIYPLREYCVTTFICGLRRYRQIWD